MGLNAQAGNPKQEAPPESPTGPNELTEFYSRVLQRHRFAERSARIWVFEKVSVQAVRFPKSFLMDSAMKEPFCRL